MTLEKGTAYNPRKIILPGDFKVKVNQLKPMQMKKKHGDFYDGIWDIENMCVDLNRKLPHKRKWYVFSHEVAHVVNDWMHYLVNKEIAQG
jgi:hypothetical protein